MIISDSKKFMFLHNPKSAGTSVRRALFEYDTNPLRFEFQRYVPGLERVIELFHVCAGDLSAVWPSLDLSQYFTFGFVRDPYTRLSSSWDEYRRQHPDMANAEFNEWARKHLTRANVRYDWEFTHFCPQHYFYYVGNKCIADYIGKFEQLNYEWEKVCRLMRIPFKSIAHEKDAKKYALPDRLSLDKIAPDVMERINDIYEMDFVFFDYEMFGPKHVQQRHLDYIESNTHPHSMYVSEEDIRYRPVTDVAAYWRERANQAEAEVQRLRSEPSNGK